MLYFDHLGSGRKSLPLPPFSYDQNTTPCSIRDIYVYIYIRIWCNKNSHNSSHTSWYIIALSLYCRPSNVVVRFLEQWARPPILLRLRRRAQHGADSLVKDRFEPLLCQGGALNVFHSPDVSWKCQTLVKVKVLYQTLMESKVKVLDQTLMEADRVQRLFPQLVYSLHILPKINLYILE